jgi:diguanylate cyclase (GGDEF)-like protein
MKVKGRQDPAAIVATRPWWTTMHNGSKLWTEHLSPWVTVGLLSLLLTMAIVATSMVVGVTQAADARALSIGRLSALRQVLSLIAEAQADADGYVISGDAQMLASYAGARAQLTGRLIDLRRLTADDSQQTTYAHVLESVALDRLDAMQRQIDARRAGNWKDATREVGSERSQRLRLAMRNVAAVMESAELDVIGSRVEQFNRQRTRSLRALWSLTAVAFFGTAGAAWQLRRDLRRLRTHEHVLQIAATHDALTGLSNRRSFEEALAQALSKAGGESRFALLMADLDHFKDVNDTLGHQAGDEVLRVVAARLREALRDVDAVARIGGEEFAALLRGLDASAARLAAERVRDSIGDAPIVLRDSHPGKSLRITVSVGLALYPEDGATLASLLESADRALYAAKQSGRNRVMSVIDLPAPG